MRKWSWREEFLNGWQYGWLTTITFFLPPSVFQGFRGDEHEDWLAAYLGGHLATYACPVQKHIPPQSFLLWFFRLEAIVNLSQWPRGRRRRSAAARLLKSSVRIPPGAWLWVCCECCVLSGRGLCDEPITRPEESYRLWCVVVCAQETSGMRRSWPAWGLSSTGKKNKYTVTILDCSLIWSVGWCNNSLRISTKPPVIVSLMTVWLIKSRQDVGGGHHSCQWVWKVKQSR
jgi:hypothetical protein